MLKEVRVGHGKGKEDRLGNRQRNLRKYFQRIDKVSNYFLSFSCSTHTFSSWYSLLSLWHSIMISASSSFFGLLLLLFLLLSLLGCKGDGEAGDEVGESKSSSLLYTTWGEGNNPGHHAALSLGKLYQDSRESWHLNQGLIEYCLIHLPLSYSRLGPVQASGTDEAKIVGGMCCWTFGEFW